MKPATCHIDLHSHSTASDGRLAPAALVQAASAAGVRVLALTDHDTVGGLDEADAAARACGLRLVPGVELSVTWNKRTIHVLGLAIDPAAAALQAALARLQACRTERAERIAAKLEKRGVGGALAYAATLADGGQLTRTHFARVLVYEGYCRDVAQAFKQYLAQGRSAHVASEWIDLETAVAAIRAAGGYAVLAHPMKYRLRRSGREQLYQAFAAAGGVAVEVCCGNTTPQDVRTLGQEARAHGLYGSAGSDFHGPEQHWLGLGRVAPLPEGVTPLWTQPGFADPGTPAA